MEDTPVVHVNQQLEASLEADFVVLESTAKHPFNTFWAVDDKPQIVQWWTPVDNFLQFEVNTSAVEQSYVESCDCSTCFTKFRIKRPSANETRQHAASQEHINSMQVSCVTGCATKPLHICYVKLL